MTKYLQTSGIAYLIQKIPSLDSTIPSWFHLNNDKLIIIAFDYWLYQKWKLLLTDIIDFPSIPSLLKKNLRTYILALYTAYLNFFYRG